MNNSCAVHPGNAATFTCSRCGSFACDVCRSSEPGLCVRCDSLRGSILGADVSAGGLIGDSFRLLGQFGAAVAAFAVVDAGLDLLVALGTQAMSGSILASGIIGVVIGAAVTSVVQGAWISLLSSAAYATPIGIGAALERGLRAALPLFVCNFLYVLAVTVATLFFIVPGIIVALGLALGPSAVLVSNRGPLQALDDSWRMTNGHKGTLFLALLGTGMVVLVVALGVGFAVGMVQARIPGSELFLQKGTAVITNIASAPVLTVPVLAYLRLLRASPSA